MLLKLYKSMFVKRYSRAVPTHAWLFLIRRLQQCGSLYMSIETCLNICPTGLHEYSILSTDATKLLRLLRTQEVTKW